MQRNERALLRNHLRILQACQGAPLSFAHFPTMGGVTGFLNIVAATGGAALLLYSTDALFYYTDER